MQTIFNETLAVLFSNVVHQRTNSTLCPVIVFPSGLRIWCLAVCAHNCDVFVWFPSDERHSVQPSNQVHRRLHRSPQHLHRHRILPPRQPAGKLTCHVSSTVDEFNCFSPCQERKISKCFILEQTCLEKHSIQISSDVVCKTPLTASTSVSEKFLTWAMRVNTFSLRDLVQAAILGSVCVLGSAHWAWYRVKSPPI